MAEEIICTKLITAGYASAFLTSSAIKDYFLKKFLALTKDVPENIQR